MTRKFKGDALLVATHNVGKMAEFRRLLSNTITIKSAGDIDLPDVEETGSTFLENAQLKALHATKFSDMPALADDSGFCLDGLDGRPGLYSARVAKELGGYPETFKAFDQELGEKTRVARFVCVLCLAWPDGHVEYVEGNVQGRFVYPPMGDNGFGYDPVFIPDGYDVSFAQMGDAKNKISHRALAIEKMLDLCFLG